jgi:DnaJ-domain-containing protein 1
VTDDFACFGVPRRPWLDSESLKQRFLALSAETHPDRFHTAIPEEKTAAHARYARLNSAYNHLREPKSRLRHFLELERGAPPSELQRIPPELMDLFLQVGQLCREADVFLAEKTAATSPLLKVALFERGHAMSERLAALRQVVDARQETLSNELQALDKAWTEADAPAAAAREALLSRLEELYRLFSYFGRWSAQLGERGLQCAI